MKHKVIISTAMRREILKNFKTLLSDIAEVRFISPSLIEEFLEELKDTEALVPLNETIGEELLKHAPKLKVISRLGVGYDKIDLEACSKKGIYVTHTPGVLSGAVAELTIGLMLCLARRIIEADHYVRTEWARKDRALLPLRTNLSGKTLGIIGLGRIGSEVARRAKAFNMKLVYHDKVRKEGAEEELGVKRMGLDELLRTSDFVTLHVPLAAETAGLIGERELKLMKKTAYLINTSRGSVVDEKALCRALKESWIAGAGIDVFTEEPLPFESPLIKMKNVVLTPHMATHTVETRRLMVSNVVENIRKVLLGEAPPNLVPEQKGKVFKK